MEVAAGRRDAPYVPPDAPKEECGVIGVYAPGDDVARIAFFGLFALQHRGQESAGIAVSDGDTIKDHTAMGLVTQAFREQDLERLTGHIAIGHTRYSTTGSSLLCNAQPILVNGPYGELALGHNGNVVNPGPLRAELEDWGCVFSASTDSETLAHLLANAPGKDWGERVQYLMRRAQGAYSLVVLTKDSLMAIRDPLGRPPPLRGQAQRRRVDCRLRDLRPRPSWRTRSCGRSSPGRPSP